MPSTLMVIFVAMDIVFAGCGGLILGFSLMSEQNLRASPTVDNVAKNLLLDQCPLTGTTPPRGSGKRWNGASILWHDGGGNCATGHWTGTF